MPATTPRQKPFPDAPEHNGKEKGNGYARPTFVRCDLNADQKKEMAEWSNGRNADDLLDFVFESVQDGYVLSIKEGEVGFQASITQSRSAGSGVRNSGKCLVTRASTPERALWSLAYKHTQVLDKDWGKASQEQALEW